WSRHPSWMGAGVSTSSRPRVATSSRCAGRSVSGVPAGSRSPLSTSIPLWLYGRCATRSAETDPRLDASSSASTSPAVSATSGTGCSSTTEIPRSARRTPASTRTSTSPRKPKPSSSGTPARPAGPKPSATAASNSTVPRSSYGPSPPGTPAACLPTSSRAPELQQAQQADYARLQHCLNRLISAERGRTGFRRRDPDQAAALFDHGGAVVVPVRMLPGDGAVVLDQRFHRLGQADDLDVATELRPVAEKPVIEHTQPGSGVAADVQGLHCGFAGTDDQTILRVDADEYRRQLRRAVTFHGCKNGMWVLTGERECFCGVHISGKSIRIVDDASIPRVASAKVAHKETLRSVSFRQLHRDTSRG